MIYRAKGENKLEKNELKGIKRMVKEIKMIVNNRYFGDYFFMVLMVLGFVYYFFILDTNKKMNTSLSCKSVLSTWNYLKSQTSKEDIDKIDENADGLKFLADLSVAESFITVNKYVKGIGLPVLFGDLNKDGFLSMKEVMISISNLESYIDKKKYKRLLESLSKSEK